MGPVRAPTTTTTTTITTTAITTTRKSEGTARRGMTPGGPLLCP